MVNSEQIYHANVMHKRMFPNENSFTYSVYYLAMELPARPISGWLTSFHAKDLGKRNGEDPQIWAREILSQYDLNEVCSRIILVTMPRILGYVFNPVSFYFCLDSDSNLRATLCEVHNTFGEQHTYLCAHPDHSPIGSQDWLEADKIFHVSPFLERSGVYRFRFDLRPDKLGIWIDFYDKSQNKQLITSLIGNFSPLTPQLLRNTFWRHPLVTLKVISLIHWQALRLVCKGIRYIPKPKQLKWFVSTSRGLNKNSET